MSILAKAQLISGFRGFAAMLFMLAASPLLSEAGISFKIISIGFGIHYTILALSEIPTGVWADVFGSKKSAVAGNFIQATSQLIFAFSESQTTFVLVGFMLTGLGTSFVSGALSSLMYSAAESESNFDSNKYFSVLEKTSVGSYILASLSIGFLSQYFGQTTFFFSAATFAVAAVATFVGFKDLPPEREHSSLRKEFMARLKEGISGIQKSLQLKILLPVRMLHQVETILGVLWLPWISQLGSDAKWMSVLATGSYVLRYLVNQYFSSKERPVSYIPRLVYALVCMALGSTICVFAENVFVGLFGVWTMAGARGAFLPAVQAIQHEEFSEKVRTTGLSVMNFSTEVMIAGSYFLSSVVIDKISVSTAWAISAGCFIFAGFLALFAISGTKTSVDLNQQERI